MSKQIYIDSNGNEIQVSGTVNTADIMPMSGNDSTKVSEAIGDVSSLTTTANDLAGAVNEVNANKPTNTNANPLFKVKQTANITKTISANSSATILGNEVNLAQSGYTPVGVLSFYQTGSTCVVQSFDYRIISGTGVFCTIRNVGSSSVNMTANFNVLFARNDIVTG